MANSVRAFWDIGNDVRPTSAQKFVYVLKHALYLELVDGAKEFKMNFWAFMLSCSTSSGLTGG